MLLNSLQILSRLKEIQEKLETSDQSSLASKLSNINGFLSIIEGNQTEFSDTVLQTLDLIIEGNQTEFSDTVLQTLDRMQTATQLWKNVFIQWKSRTPIRESRDQMEVKRSFRAMVRSFQVRSFQSIVR